MLIKGWHGGELRPEPPSELYLAHHRDLARTYAAGKGKTYKVTYETEHPLEIHSGHEIHQLIQDAGGFGENWHPDTTHRIANVARERGHDAIIIHPAAFKDEDQEAWEHAAGTYGDPQTVALHPHKAIFEPTR